jgi:hypothetical protein
MALPMEGCAPKEPSPRPKLEVADIFRAHVSALLCAHPVSDAQLDVIGAILACRTAQLGGHRDVCTACGHELLSYNSCRDRHCPKCQSLAQGRWVQERKERILPTPYFHVVFTLPQELRPLCRANATALYGLLFSAAAETLLAFGREERRLGAQLGLTAVLHTWTRELRYHPHLHCIVTGGGLSLDGTRWVQGSARYLFPVQLLATVFRGKFLAGLRRLHDRGTLELPPQSRWHGPGFEVLLARLYQQPWVVYAKRPLGGAAQVFSYLGRYTHRTGISNQRLVSMSQEGVCFRTKGGNRKTLPPVEFLRRFLQHVLPPGFVKIRHYGLLSSVNVKTKLQAARRLLSTSAESPPAAPAESPPPPSPAAESSPMSVEAADGQPLADILERSRCLLCRVGITVRHRLLPRPFHRRDWLALCQPADTS